MDCTTAAFPFKMSCSRFDSLHWGTALIKHCLTTAVWMSQTTIGTAGALKYVLYEYEEHLAGKHGVKVSWDVFDTGDPQRTLEHVLPQTADQKCWRDRFDRVQRRRLTHDIGNLCLTEDNSAYGNKCFVEKKGEPGKGRCYANSNLYQERELLQYADWTEEAILNRRQKITEWFISRWHLDDADMPDDVGAVADEVADDSPVVG